MKFVQIIEYKTSRYDEIDKLTDEWLKSTAGKRTTGRSMEGRDRERPDTYVTIVEFPSYEIAMKNSEMPETQQFAEQMTKLCDGPATFRNLDIVREEDS